MPPFCFTCERERTREFQCRVCGERECAICADANEGLCEACTFELQSAATLQRFFAVDDHEPLRETLERRGAARAATGSR